MEAHLKEEAHKVAELPDSGGTLPTLSTSSEASFSLLHEHK